MTKEELLRLLELLREKNNDGFRAVIATIKAFLK
jgi:hypothetical protein